MANSSLEEAEFVAIQISEQRLNSQVLYNLLQTSG